MPLPVADAFGLLSKKLDHQLAYTSGKFAHRMFEHDTVQTALKQAIICQHVTLAKLVQETNSDPKALNDVLQSLTVHYGIAAGASSSENYYELFVAGMGASKEIQRLTEKYLPGETIWAGKNASEMLVSGEELTEAYRIVKDLKNNSNKTVGTKLLKKYAKSLDQKVGFDSSCCLMPGVESPSSVLVENLLPAVKEHKELYRNLYLKFHPEDKHRFMSKQILSKKLSIAEVVDLELEQLRENQYTINKRLLSNVLKNEDSGSHFTLVDKCVNLRGGTEGQRNQVVIDFDQDMTKLSKLITKLYRWKKRLTLVFIIGGLLFIVFKKRSFLKRFIKKIYRYYKIVTTNRFINNRFTRSILTLMRYTAKHPHTC